MGGFFAVTSEKDCIFDLFYGTDYHSHLGTCRGGLAVLDGTDFRRHIHNISNAPFRTKFEKDILAMRGNSGIGVISDMEPQPLIISSHLGRYAIATVSRVSNLDFLVQDAFNRRVAHFSETGSIGINPTELIATLINEKTSFEAGISYAQERVEGSCSILLLTEKGIYVARDRFGRTPIITASKEGAVAATLENAVFPNLDYTGQYYLGPGEILRLTPEGIEQLRKPDAYKQVCAFLWVYYGFPASSYENINVESCRYRCGARLAEKDTVEADFVAGIPESGTGYAIGYANAKTVPYGRPFTKYTTTWPRSFMSPGQTKRKLVARMKLIPVPDLVQAKRLLFCDDSIVRGVQLADTIKRLYEAGAREVHMRPACPPLLFACKYLNFSRSKSEMDLIARRTVRELEGGANGSLEEYTNPDSEKYKAMVDRIRQRLCLTTLKYQRLDDLIAAIGLPREDLCTYCWDGCEGQCGRQMTFANGIQETKD